MSHPRRGRSKSSNTSTSNSTITSGDTIGGTPVDTALTLQFPGSTDSDSHTHNYHTIQTYNSMANRSSQHGVFTDIAKGFE